MTIDASIIHCHKTVIFFMNYNILSASCYLCTNIYYVSILIGSCPVIIDNMYSLWRICCHAKY